MVSFTENITEKSNIGDMKKLISVTLLISLASY